MVQFGFMKVSIVIPCYNEEKWVEKTVLAALAQDYSNFEIVLVNNASTDNTNSVLERLQSAHPEKIILTQEPRPGVLMAREAGRVAATGDIIAQLDADCLPPPNWIRRAVPKFKQGVVAVAGSYDYYDGSFRIRYQTLVLLILFMRPINYLVQKFKKRAAFEGGNVFILASVLEKAGGYNKVDTFYGDEIDTASRIIPYGFLVSMPWLIVKTSARRYKALGFKAVQAKYDISSWSALKENVIRMKETIHPR